jgi:putative ATP-binding cassette transporter
VIRSNFHAIHTVSNPRSVALFLIVLAIGMTAAFKARQCTVRILHNLALNLFDQNILRLYQTTFASFENLGRASLYNTIMVDTQKLVELSDDVAVVQQALMIAVSGFVFLLWLSPLAFGLTLGALAVGIVLIAMVYPRVRTLIQTSREREKDLFHAINHLLFGFKELKMNPYKMADFFQENLGAAITAYKHLRIRAKYLSADVDMLSTFLDYARFIPILFVLPFLSHASQSIIPQLVAVMLFIPLTDLKGLINDVLTANIAVTRLTRLQHTLAELGSEEIQWPAKTPRHFQTLAYQSISFIYTDQQGEPTFTIGPLNLTLTAGEVVFLIGGNGSGKTTLLKVMTGLYLPLSGRIELDGVDVQMAQHRYLFSTIFTDFHLFDRLYGLPDVQPEQVQVLLERMALTHKVHYHDGQFSTQDLSGGQRKRLALITSLLEDKPIYIFDEWAAGQDPEFREYFYLTLLPTFKQAGKTIFAITHDDQYFHVADRILKMEPGQLVTIK